MRESLTAVLFHLLLFLASRDVIFPFFLIVVSYMHLYFFVNYEYFIKYLDFIC